MRKVLILIDIAQFYFTFSSAFADIFPHHQNMNNQPHTGNGHALTTVNQHPAETDCPSSLTLDELRELPHMFALGFDIDAHHTKARTTQS